MTAYIIFNYMHDMDGETMNCDAWNYCHRKCIEVYLNMNV